MIGRAAITLKYLILSILFLVNLSTIPTSICAQDDPCPLLNDHPQEKQLQQEFLRSRIEVTAGTQATNLSQRVPSTIDLSSSKHWSAYRDSGPLSEEAFFALCGYEEEASQARRHYASAKGRISRGGFLTKAGLATWIAGLLTTIGASYEIGVPIIVVGAGTTGIGWAMSHSGYTSRYQSWATFGRAQAVADEYNRKLCESLTGK